MMEHDKFNVENSTIEGKKTQIQEQGYMDSGYINGS